MPTTVTRFKSGTAGTTDGSAYAVPSSNTAIITNVILSNKTGSTRTVTITMGGLSFCTGLQVPPNGTVNFDARTVLNAAETITVIADVAAAVDYMISGVLIS
jgi:hypothetical protein